MGEGKGGETSPSRGAAVRTPALVPNEGGATRTSSCPRVTCNCGRLMYFRICFDMYLQTYFKWFSVTFTDMCDHHHSQFWSFFITAERSAAPCSCHSYAVSLHLLFRSMTVRLLF